MRIICISGKARHGKDTAAEILQKTLWGYGRRVLIVHYGDLVKFICEKFFKWDGEKDEAGRQLLQRVGTDVVRNTYDKDYWVKFIAEMLTFFDNEWDYVLIPDTRFPNEIQYLKDKGFDVLHIRVNRDDCDSGLTEGQLAHESETSLDNADYDYVLDNNGTLSDLTWRILKMTTGLFQEQW